MKRYRISDFGDAPVSGHIFAPILQGRRIYNGGLSFHTPGMVTHNEERPHVEVDQELFCLIQGEGWIEVDGVREPVSVGDVLVIEPGEDHHLISSDHSPLINLWLHANDVGRLIQPEN